MVLFTGCKPAFNFSILSFHKEAVVCVFRQVSEVLVNLDNDRHDTESTSLPFKGGGLSYDMCPSPPHEVQRGKHYSSVVYTADAEE